MTSSVVENIIQSDETQETDSMSEVPLERLEADLVGLAGHLAAATAQWLTWLCEYDRRQGWQQWACRSAAHWLSWKCGMSLSTARTHVRIARALEELPLVAFAFAEGQLSFSKVRALTRLAHPIDEAAMLDVARWSTASQLDRLIAGCVTATNNRNGAPAPTKPAYRTRTLDNGTVEITVTVSDLDAERIKTTIDALTDRTIAERTPEISLRERVAHLGGWNTIRAEAATQLLTATAESSAADPVELTIHVELTPKPTTPPRADSSSPEATSPKPALSEFRSAERPPSAGHGEQTEHTQDRLGARLSDSGRHLPGEIVRRLGCDAIIAVSESPTGRDNGRDQRVGVGRRQRVVPTWLRRQLERRDNHCCQFPGCATTRRLHAHHIVHWANGGPTDLENLLLLCSFHHHVVHERGWTIEGTVHSHIVRTPNGSAATIPQLTGHPSALDPLRPEQLDGVAAHWDGQPLDIHYAVSVLTDHHAQLDPHAQHRPNEQHHPHEQHRQPGPGNDPTLN